MNKILKFEYQVILEGGYKIFITKSDRDQIIKLIKFINHNIKKEVFYHTEKTKNLIRISKVIAIVEVKSTQESW